MEGSTALLQSGACPKSLRSTGSMESALMWWGLSFGAMQGIIFLLTHLWACDLLIQREVKPPREGWEPDVLSDSCHIRINTKSSDTFHVRAVSFMLSTSGCESLILGLNMVQLGALQLGESVRFSQHYWGTSHLTPDRQSPHPHYFRLISYTAPPMHLKLGLKDIQSHQSWASPEESLPVGLTWLWWVLWKQMSIRS